MILNALLYCVNYRKLYLRYDPWKQKGIYIMPNPVKKVRRADKLLQKLKGPDNKESHDLRKLLSLLETNAHRHQVAVLSQSCKVRNSGGRSQTILQLNIASNNRSQIHITSEDHELEKFSATYRNQHCFNSHPQHKLFLEILTSLVKNRLCSDWVDHAPPESVLRVLICLRLLVREPLYQRVFHQLQGVDLLARYMELVCSSYLGCGEQTFAMEKLVTMTYMLQKLSAVEDQRQWVIESGAHKTLVKLLSTRDSSVLLGALLALTSLAESSECKKTIGELSIVENLLVILQDYDLLSKRMSAELLRLLSPVRQVREQVRECEGLPVLLSLLHGEHLKLLWSVVWVLVQLCEEPDTSAEIRTWGGVQQLLHILDSERAYVSDRSSIEALCSANAAGRIQRQHVSEELSPQEDVDDTMSLQSACCAALTELVLDDTTAHQVVQENGVYVIAKLILPQSFRNGPKAISLQCYAFRTLRFLFSMECNRHLFKRLFPTDLFELFIDVGHYVRDITVYEALQAKVSLYTQEELDSLRENIETVDQNRPPLRVINGYSILDHLGTGAFGSVFKVRKQSGQNLLALKEVNLHNPAFGKDKKSRDSNVEKIVSELTIIKEQMTHPNVVKYYKTFLKGDRLYIVMELIEGVPLWDHFNSLKEKEQQFTEERLWNIFIQMCLALRYLHKEKRIVHRDLTPNNVMLGERDKVTISQSITVVLFMLYFSLLMASSTKTRGTPDFGLAKQKQENSKLTSVVGTILYSCPEIVKSEPYGEKADVWASGCILYQMATLRPPFYSSNMLSLATKIVEAVYEPVEEGIFSERVTDMIKCCLTTDADLRPDIVEVSSKISDIMMRFMDSLYTSQNALERRAERDRKRAQKYFLESHRGRVSCCHSSKDQEKTSTRTDSDESMVPYFSLGHSSNQSKKIPSQDNGSDKDLDPFHTNISTVSGYKDAGPIKSSVSASVVDEPNLAGGEFAVPKPKPRPVSAGICVSQRKVRQIDDPVQRLLVQLHKIIYITQLPPALQHSVKRRAIERFKKSLFHYESSPYNLKVELNKLLQGSPELMESGSASSDWWSLVQSFGGDHLGAAKQAGLGDMENGDLKEGISYEQMQAIIEEVLEENGYYNAMRIDQGATGRNQ
ncbi:serine/threonine-protein kinase Nek10 isoform X2 [Oncorhynchus kisutch]|uniref:serine/threonine-protein kinase Nek10 isoform X2 n=2 Tax=Oncorhynchus kisutch TaxID=8019 RepID=UPI0012DE5339|nr:serine/threonine-protein kinase Nek10 isoform X2 [Oncorhynchus kisutch]